MQPFPPRSTDPPRELPAAEQQPEPPARNGAPGRAAGGAAAPAGPAVLRTGTDTLTLQIEREIALEADDLQAVAAALRAGAVSAQRVVEERENDQLTTYYDTADHLLASRKCSLRLRRLADGRSVVTLKLREVSRAHDVRARPELEASFEPEADQVAIWSSLPARLARQCADDHELGPDLVLATR